ncbi:hypothetical protein [Pseudomonas multiresinivorans]|uniref:Uncharacterized protein n=1 Tax=Pseudomonas multiresinivorans TaxID=95301 RepID=A0A7Z3BJ05_9PSED|nr:hypothetical protein [Pseudomonas multiresinivorans]QJP07678.1 hypothetical protein G4G71_07175 [Pseudomonas multiresinivorans]
MNFLDTAFRQLAFAWKLHNYACEGNLDLDVLDRPITYTDGGSSIFVLPDKVLNSHNDLILALENNLVIAFGAAAITLNRCREEAGIALGQDFQSETNNFSAVVYQIRNAFAHDIAEPKWNITDPRYARVYEFGDMRFDLTAVGRKPFEYQDIGGPDAIFRIKEYAQRMVWPDFR